MPLFQPYRALGLVTSGAPYALHRQGPETYLTVSIGRAWQLYDVAKLRLLLVGPELPSAIQALACFREWTYAAHGTEIAVFSRAHQVASMRGHSGAVQHLLTFGDSVLLSVAADHSLLLWALIPPQQTQPKEGGNTNTTDSANGQPSEWGQGALPVLAPLSRIELQPSFSPSCLMHPDTYLNKVLLGSQEGRLQLWNVNSATLIHEFPGWGSPVRCCVGSPALDTVAVGLEDGSIRVHNLRYDREVVTFHHEHAVEALSFRTDGQPWLASGDSSGDIALWDLEKRRLGGMVKEAHDAPLSLLHFLPGEPVLLSSAPDNSIKMWVFDQHDSGAARLLRFRSGHGAPPCCIQYYGNGRHILSAGHDRAFRVFSTTQDQRNRELSQGHKERKAKARNVKVQEVKLPPVLALDSSEVRERDWANVVTCHEGHSAAYLWHLRTFAIGQSTLRPPGKAKHSAARVCCISACGNFGIVGYEAGELCLFNLQSALLRCSFRASRDTQSTAHAGAVSGVSTDSRNRHVLSVSSDGFAKRWNMHKGRLEKSVDLGSPITGLCHNRVSGLLALALADASLRVLDSQALRTVREFRGHSQEVSALELSSDGRWLLSASLDSSLRVWDVVRGTPLAAMRLPLPALGLSLAPEMSMLATIHPGLKGIYLWSNKAMYSGLEDADLLSSAAPGGEDQVALPGVVAPDGSGEEQGQGEGEGEREGRGQGTEGDLKAVALAEVEVGEQPRKRARKGADSITQGQKGETAAAGTGSGPTTRNASRGEMLLQHLPVTPNLLTLGLLPRAQWLNLINLDAIKERNRPIEPPKTPEAAPFFLPTTPSLLGQPVFSTAPQGEGELQRDGEVQQEQEQEQGRGRVRRLAGEQVLQLEDSPFAAAVRLGAETGDYREAVALLTSMSPSAVDAELRAVEIVDVTEAREEEVDALLRLVAFLTTQLRAKNNFELFQAVTLRFTTIHGEALAHHSRLRQAASALLEVQSSSWERLDSLFSYLRCMASFMLDR